MSGRNSQEQIVECIPDADFDEVSDLSVIFFILSFFGLGPSVSLAALLFFATFSGFTWSKIEIFRISNKYVMAFAQP